MASLRTPTLLVLGAGFLGRAVAEEAQRGGWKALPVVRSEESAVRLREVFPEALATDAVAEDFWRSQVPDCDALIWSMSPSRSQTDDDFTGMHRKGVVRAAQWARRRHLPFVYISSTSVYAEDHGGWVDEYAPVAFGDARAMAMVEAERACLAAGGSVLRCAGLYGKDRMLKSEGEGPERWLNLIHVEDAARAVAIALRNPGLILNVCEDEPRRRGQPGGLWPGYGRRTRRNKRVNNARLRALGWKPMATIPDAEWKQSDVRDSNLRK